MPKAVSHYSESAISRLHPFRPFPIKGDLQEPVFRRGDVALVRPCDRFDEDGYYVVGIEDPAIYRISKRSNGEFLLGAANPHYKSYTVTADWLEDNLLAIVVGRFEAMRVDLLEVA